MISSGKEFRKALMSLYTQFEPTHCILVAKNKYVCVCVCDYERAESYNVVSISILVGIGS